MILRLWRDWCRLWPEQYGHNSLEVQPAGYDPVFDVIPSQAYKDFYLEVVRGHPKLKSLNVFEVIDTALNQIRAPESSVIAKPSAEGNGAHAPARAADHARVAEVSLPDDSEPPYDHEADTA